MPAPSGARSSPNAVWLATAGLVVAAVAPFHVAANDDNSPMGDVVYTREFVLR